MDSTEKELLDHYNQELGTNYSELRHALNHIYWREQERYSKMPQEELEPKERLTEEQLEYWDYYNNTHKKL